MTDKLIIALATAARAFANALYSENTCSAPCGESAPCGGTPEPAPAETKTRKPRATKEPAPAPEPQPAPEPTPAEEPAADAAAGDITDEQLKAAIQPLVQDGRTAEAKAVIKKYAESLTKIAPDKRKAFLADIEALSL